MQLLDHWGGIKNTVAASKDKSCDHKSQDATHKTWLQGSRSGSDDRWWWWLRSFNGFLPSALRSAWTPQQSLLELVCSVLFPMLMWLAALANNQAAASAVRLALASSLQPQCLFLDLMDAFLMLTKDAHLLRSYRTQKNFRFSFWSSGCVGLNTRESRCGHTETPSLNPVSSMPLPSLSLIFLSVFDDIVSTCVDCCFESSNATSIY